MLRVDKDFDKTMNESWEMKQQYSKMPGNYITNVYTYMHLYVPSNLNKIRTKFPNSNVSRLILMLSLPNQMEVGVWVDENENVAQLRLSDR